MRRGQGVTISEKCPSTFHPLLNKFDQAFSLKRQIYTFKIYINNLPNLNDDPSIKG